MTVFARRFPPPWSNQGYDDTIIDTSFACRLATVLCS
jgi:hypothetical protein